MKEEIKAWFASERNFTEGVKLYEKYGSNKILLRLFNRGHNKHIAEKLTWELHKLGDIAENQCYSKSVSLEEVKTKKVVKSTAKTTKTLKTPVIDNNKITEFKDLPKIIKDLLTEKGILIRERAVKHKEMGDITGNSPAEKKARESLRNIIAENTSRIDIISEAVTNYDANKIIPDDSILNTAAPKEKEKPTDKASLMQQRSNLRSQVSKLKKKVAEFKGPKKKEYQVKLDKVEKELESIESQLT